MTTARAFLFTCASYSSLFAPLPGTLPWGRGELGWGFCGADGCGGRRFALRGGPVDQADEQDQAERELVDRDVGQEPGHRDVREGAERRVLAADRNVARPQEVDLHGDSPDK